MIIQINYLKIKFIRNVKNYIAVLCTFGSLIQMLFYKYLPAGRQVSRLCRFKSDPSGS
jgi:hypothetical protein